MSEATMGRRALLGTAAASAIAAPLMITGSASADPGRGDHDQQRRDQGAGRVTPGADRAAADRWKLFRGRKIGVITNPTGILQSTLGSIVDDLVEHDISVQAVFGPEHGFRGSAQAGAAEPTFVDERTGVTVYDAYGANADKFAALYAESGIDTVVFDIQDVGTRFYTYIWTLYFAMIAAAKVGKRVVILDRPNPIGGQPDGPVLQQGFTSGVGQDVILQAHGMTVGEVARYFNGELIPGLAGGKVADLQVVEVKGWKPSMLYADTGLAWVPPSPNMPTPDTALLYPGTGLFEAVNMSEGRGTTRPFELIGAPYVDHRWAAELNKRHLAGVQFREAYFTPSFSKHLGKVCGGVQVHLTDPAKIRPITIAAHMMTAARDLYDEFDWRDGTTPGPTDGGRWAGLLSGSARFGDQIEAGATAEEIVAGWQSEVAAFRRTRRPYLLYRR